MFVRLTTARDIAKIPPLVEAAFGRHDEGLLVTELRDHGDMVLEFVATDREQLIGHVMLSRMVSPPLTLVLAPVSVHPDWQGKGIGSTLVRAATEAAEEAGWTAIFVLGDPNFYGRFGFEVEQAEAFDTPYQHESTGACVFNDEDFSTLPLEIIYPRAFS
jgi:putative acetyltransferase